VALLAAIRLRIRDDLDDAASTLWTDAELDRFISHALRQLSHAIPRQQSTTIATTNGSRAVSITALTPRVRIVAVEYPTGTDPRTYVDFSSWIDTLTITSGPVPSGGNCIVYWHSQHTLDVSTSTLSEEEEEILIAGAEGYACRQQAAYAVNRISTGGPGVDRDWKTLSADLLAEFWKGIRDRAKVGVRRLYIPSQPTPTQDTDPGP